MGYRELDIYIDGMVDNIKAKYKRHGMYKPDEEARHLASVVSRAVVKKSVTYWEYTRLTNKIKLLFSTL